MRQAGQGGSGALKLQLTESLSNLADSRASDTAWMGGKSYPASVVEVVSSGIVTVKFELDTTPFTPQQITIPIGYWEYVRYPVQVGNLGMVISADALLGGVTGQGSGTASISQPPPNLGACVFLALGNTNWVDPIDPDSTELYGVNQGGVIARSAASTNVLTISETTVTLDLGTDMTINTNGNDLYVSGGGDVIINGISFLDHYHPDVASGSDDTGPPES